MRAGVEIAAWWVAGMLIWTATLSSASAAELLAGALSALGTAVLARLARLAMNRESGRRRDADARGPDRLPLARELPRWALLVPVAVALDVVRLSGRQLGRLARWSDRGSGQPDGGQPIRRSLPAGHGASATSWRQGAVVVVSATLGSLVVDVDGDDGSMLLDPLIDGWPDLDRRVSR